MKIYIRIMLANSMSSKSVFQLSIPHAACVMKYSTYKVSEAKEECVKT